MGADDGDVYMLRPDEDGTDEDDEETWVSPQPASEVIIDAVAEAVDEDRDELDALSEYVDIDELAELFTGDEDDDASISLEIEGHDVTVHRSGEIDVDGE
jgi:hypothetical protein